MASPIENLTTLDKPKHIEAWIGCFTVLSRVKKFKDEKDSEGEDEITDIFLVTVGHEAAKKVSIAYPREYKRINLRRDC